MNKDEYVKRCLNLDTIIGDILSYETSGKVKISILIKYASLIIMEQNNIEQAKNQFINLVNRYCSGEFDDEE